MPNSTQSAAGPSDGRRLDLRVKIGKNPVKILKYPEDSRPPMSTVIRIADYRNAAKRIKPDICFNKRELDQLLSVYSRRVMSGEWKDYAIHHDPAMAAFMIYRNNTVQPSFTVIKRFPHSEKPEYLVYHGRERLKKSSSLSDALSVLKRRFKVVGKQ